ncbi:MAG: hypothetical protein U0941_21655 [Planctomycetaceae bacterium]
MAEGTTLRLSVTIRRTHCRLGQRCRHWRSDGSGPDPDLAGACWLIGTRKQAKSCRLNVTWQDCSPGTSWILLLSHPGINVVSAAEVGGECGPIQNYACPKAITGRGTVPLTLSKRQGGPRWKSLTIPQCEDAPHSCSQPTIRQCNEYWRGKYNLWKSQGHDPRDLRCRVANRFTRTVFQMIAGRKIYQHRSRLDRGYIMQKLLEFLRDRQTPAATILTILKDAADQLPTTARAKKPSCWPTFNAKPPTDRRSEPQELGSLLVHGS